MVDNAKDTDIQSLMSQKQWGTDDFQRSLQTHTEQVTSIGDVTAIEIVRSLLTRLCQETVLLILCLTSFSSLTKNLLQF